MHLCIIDWCMVYCMVYCFLATDMQLPLRAISADGISNYRSSLADPPQIGQLPSVLNTNYSSSTGFTYAAEGNLQ